GPLDVDLGDLVVLEDGDPLLAYVDGDQQLPLRGRQRRAARRRSAALLLLSAPAGALGRLSLRAGLLAGRLGLRLGRGSRGVRLLLTTPTAAASASALGLRLVARRAPGGRPLGYGLGLGRALRGGGFLGLPAPENTPPIK